jgi:dolichol-phosphate mannosyltransferase
MARSSTDTLVTLGMRERFRDDYWQRRDPISDDRLQWRAQTFRHLVHLLPGESILELGAGSGLFTTQLHRLTRGANPLTAVSFQVGTSARPADLPPDVEYLQVTELPGPLASRQFDYVIAMDLLDQRNSPWFLQHVLALLAPGGEVVFYESNPWNVVLNARRLVGRLIGRPDPRSLLSRARLYELLSEVGFIRTFAVFNDFVYAPLPRPMMWAFRNLSILLENTPVVQTLAGSLMIHAQKPPRLRERPAVSLARHVSLRGAVSVVVPCHNEEMNIGPLVNALRRLYDEYIHEIVLVDDNSTDSTAAVIADLAAHDSRIICVSRRPPNGVGRALMDGYRAATGQYVLSMDCDFQHLLPEFSDLFDRAAEGHDVVIGSRFSRHSVLLNYPIKKAIANRGFHALAQMLLRRRFRDVTNNLKLVRRELLNRFPLSQPGFAINAETGLFPVAMGLDVVEVPISWINRTPDMGMSSFKLAQVGGGYWDVLVDVCRRTRFGTRRLPARQSDDHNQPR